MLIYKDKTEAGSLYKYMPTVKAQAQKCKLKTSSLQRSDTGIQITIEKTLLNQRPSSDYSIRYIHHTFNARRKGGVQVIAAQLLEEA